MAAITLAAYVASKPNKADSTYEINRNVMLKLSVQNLMNKNYSEALNKLNMMPIQGDDGTAANTARGRTYIFGGEIRF